MGADALAISIASATEYIIAKALTMIESYGNAPAASQRVCSCLR
jgi:hypothetical protein